MNTTQIIVLASLVGLFIVIPLSVIVFRLAVRFVAGYAPGVWNTVLALFMSGIVAIALAKGVHALGVIPQKSIYNLVILLPLLAFARIVVLSQMINDGNGKSLGFLPALFSYLLAIVITWVGLAVILAGAIGLFGLKPAQAVARQYLASARNVYGTDDSPGRQSIKWPSFSLGGQPATDGSAAAVATPSETPAAVHRYFLRTPIQVPVQYGTMTIPANTEVRLLDEAGDSCRVQVGGVTYSVSREQLIGVP